jgi:sugar-specific transcriptional regulator TrmB
MEKLNRMGLIEIQPTRPKLYSTLSSDEVVNRLIEIARDSAEQFARQAEELKSTLSSLPEQARGRRTFVDLAMGVESHVKRHVIHLSAARKRIWSYLEKGDLTARPANDKRPSGPQTNRTQRK